MIQSQVSKNLLDHRPFQNGGDDLELRSPAVQAALHVEIEHPLEQPRLADESRPGLGGLDLALGGGCSLGGRAKKAEPIDADDAPARVGENRQAPSLSAPRPAYAARPPWGSSKVAKPH